MSGKCYAHGTSTEAKFRDMAQAREWSVARAGWPDFLITTDGKAEFVEVKSSNDRLSDGQVVMFTALELAGVHVKVWWEDEPSVLMGWRSFLARTSQCKPPPKLEPLPRRGKPRKYNPRALGTLERDRRLGIAGALRR